MIHKPQPPNFSLILYTESMKKDKKTKKIRQLEEKLLYADPEQTARITKRLVLLKTAFFDKD